MARPQSPHMPSTMDFVGRGGVERVSQGLFCTPHPSYVQDPLSPVSPKSSVESPTFTAIKQESPPSLSQQALDETMDFEGPMAMQWTGQSDLSTDNSDLSSASHHVPNPFGVGPGDFFPYVQNGVSYNDNCNVAYAPQYPTSSWPRSYHGFNINGLPRDVDMSPSHPPAVYQIKPQQHYDSLPDTEMNDYLMQTRDDFDHYHGSHMKREHRTGYNSPYSDLTRASTPSSESPMQDFNETMIDKEQPYAQLIYQALLQADGHTMILRDIYDWFLKYTDKAAASETKGWQNSIRHNLSMNGAFEKVDQPCEDSHKGFMWRLTAEALREGVKSTTRYRSKQPNKRGTRTHHPQPKRQASGAKGGVAARRSANVRRSKRVTEFHNRISEPYTARSVPAAFEPFYHHGSHDVQYPRSPYFGSDVDFVYDPPSFNNHHSKQSNNRDFGSSAHGMEMFPQTQSFPNQMMQMIPESAYVLTQSPSEPLFTDSPTPSAEEPRTPMSASGSGFGEMDLGQAQGWEAENDGASGMGMGYQEYAG